MKHGHVAFFAAVLIGVVAFALFAAVPIGVAPSDKTAPAADAKDKAGNAARSLEWRSLFDGKTLAGWAPLENADNWTAVEGAVKTGSRTDGLYGTKVLRSSFLLEVRGSGGGKGITVEFCMPLNKLRSGYTLHVSPHGASIFRHKKKVATSAKGPGKFRSLWLMRLGPKIICYINGSPSVTYEDSTPLGGRHVALRNNGGGMTITRMRFRPIDKLSCIIAPNADLIQKGQNEMCPVERPKPASDKFTIDLREATARFSSREAMRRFLAYPPAFIPDLPPGMRGIAYDSLPPANEDPDKISDLEEELIKGGSMKDWEVLAGGVSHNGERLDTGDSARVRCKRPLPRNFELLVKGSVGNGPYSSWGNRPLSMLFCRHPQADRGGYEIHTSNDFRMFKRNGQTLKGGGGMSGGPPYRYAFAYYVAKVGQQVFVYINSKKYCAYVDPKPLTGTGLQFGTSRLGKFRLDSISLRPVVPGDRIIAPNGDLLIEARNENCPVVPGEKAKDAHKLVWEEIPIRFSSDEAKKKFEANPTGYTKNLPPGMLRLVAMRPKQEPEQEFEPAPEPKRGPELKPRAKPKPKPKSTKPPAPPKARARPAPKAAARPPERRSAAEPAAPVRAARGPSLAIVFLLAATGGVSLALVIALAALLLVAGPAESARRKAWQRSLLLLTLVMTVAHFCLLVATLIL